MQAAYIEQYGKEDNLTLGRQPIPEILDNQVLIKVHAIAVNPVDWMVRNGVFKEHNVHTLPLILGWDAAGEIAQIGNAVTHFALGQAVYAYTSIVKQGAYAQYIAVDADLVASKPRTLNFEQSAAVSLAATTAWQALTKAGKLNAGDKISDSLAKSHQVNYHRLWVTPDRDDLNAIAKLIDSGDVKVIIDSSYPLSDIKLAHQRSQSKRAKGKIVVRITHDK